MKKLIPLLLLSLFLFSACEKRKPEVEIPLPTAPPNLEHMKPTTPPS